jgi:RNA polymerase II subunit A small phosphatase-like protein
LLETRKGNSNSEENFKFNNKVQEQGVLGVQRDDNTGKKTLVLDLDETLVHSSFKPVKLTDLIMPV